MPHNRCVALNCLRSQGSVASLPDEIALPARGDYDVPYRQAYSYLWRA